MTSYLAALDRKASPKSPHFTPHMTHMGSKCVSRHGMIPTNAASSCLRSMTVGTIPMICLRTLRRLSSSRYPQKKPRRRMRLFTLAHLLAQCAEVPSETRRSNEICRYYSSCVDFRFSCRSRRAPREPAMLLIWWKTRSSCASPPSCPKPSLTFVRVTHEDGSRVLPRQNTPQVNSSRNVVSLNAKNEPI